MPLDAPDGRPEPRPEEQRLSRRGVLARVVAQGLVLAMLVTGTAAATLRQTVTIDVDGKTSQVRTFGRTVQDVLAAQGVVVGRGDVVVPAPSEPVPHDGEIVVRHGREVVIEVDGEERTVWTTAQTVGDVVSQLGLRGEAVTSSSRSAALGRGVLKVTTPRTVHVAVDGATQEVRTTGATVRDALREAGVVLGEHDQVSVPLDTEAVAGLVVQVIRVVPVMLTETTTQPFAEVRTEDPTLLKGEEVVEVPGTEGGRAVTYLSLQVEGAEISRSVLAEAVLSRPVDRVIRVGTKVPPPPPPPPAPVAPRKAPAAGGGATAPAGGSSAPVRAPAVDPGTARAVGRDMVLARGWGEGEWSCLEALWTKESRWRVNADNPSSSAYGIPQALPGSKMASAGADWATNPATQIAWGLGYISARYGAPCAAWAHSKARNWY